MWPFTSDEDEVLTRHERDYIRDLCRGVYPPPVVESEIGRFKALVAERLARWRAEKAQMRADAKKQAEAQAERRHAFTITRGQAVFCAGCGGWGNLPPECHRVPPEAVAEVIEINISNWMTAQDKRRPGARLRIEAMEAGKSTVIMKPITAFPRRYQDVVNIYNRREPMP